jgi:hypothetical protein
MKIPKDLRRHYVLARKRGWTITVTGGGHLRWTSPAGNPVFTPCTPGGGNRSLQNSVCDLQRAGLRP